MTQEEKAKEFDASLERAKKLIETCDSAAVIGWCEYIFPMLIEPKTEDERIRKLMIDGFKDYGEPEYVWWEGVKVKECIAWLEKQGQSKKTSIWKHWKDGIAGNGDGIPVFLIKNGSTYSLSSCLGFECDYIELSELDNLMLEKQGEQNYEFNGIAESRPAKGKLKELCQELSQSKVTKISEQGWSEECDENLMMIEDRFSDYLDYIREDSSLTKHRKNTLKEEIIGYVNWLKTFKERLS